MLVGGRAAWTVQGLPTEGQIGDRRRVSNFLEPVATVGVEATIADVRAVTDQQPPVVMISDGNVVLGLIDEAASGLPDATPVEPLMVPAPGTIRPDVPIDAAVQQLRDDGLAYSLVTTARGELLGIIRLSNVHV